MATDFSMVSGDTKTLNISITDENGAALDVSTATAMTFRVSDIDGVTVFDKTLVSGITVVTDVVTVTIAASNTASLAGIYYCELQITDNNSNVFTAMQGVATILEDRIT